MGRSVASSCEFFLTRCARSSLGLYAFFQLTARRVCLNWILISLRGTVTGWFKAKLAANSPAFYLGKITIESSSAERRRRSICTWRVSKMTDYYSDATRSYLTCGNKINPRLRASISDSVVRGVGLNRKFCVLQFCEVIEIL